LASHNANARHLDEELARALAHPLRQRILMHLEREVQTPLDLARSLGEPLNKIGYHVHALREAGCIELVRTEHRRGAIAHFYRPTTRAFLTDEQWSSLPAAVRKKLVGQTISEVMTDARTAAESGGFDRPGIQVTRTELELDDEGYTAVVELLTGTVERALEIQAQSVARGGDAEHSTVLSLMHFYR
jgi:DNA-binding transcriptional ArsR family regulator